MFSSWLSALIPDIFLVFFLTLPASSAQQVQDIHVPRHETERRMPPRSQLHLCTFTGRARKVSVQIICFALSLGVFFIISRNEERKHSLSITLVRNNMKILQESSVRFWSCLFSNTEYFAL